MQYRRARIKGGTYFFTIVTYQRRKILHPPKNIESLRDAFDYVKSKHPFEIDAMVVLPDHFHFILTLPENDSDFPNRIRQIKSYFSRNTFAPEQPRNGTRIRKQEKTVWQRRYWEHVIRDEEDFARHVEYIHFNPVKHNLVELPKDWEYSSFHCYVNKGMYELNWGANQELIFGESVGHE